MGKKKKVMVIPCSGIGKAFGAISREAMYTVVDDLRPAETDTTCLGLLVMGDEQARSKVKDSPCLTIDGCPADCSRKNVLLAGGDVVKAFRVVDIYKQHTNLKPKAVAQVDEAGRELAQILAGLAAEAIDSIEEK
jgi:uncharacterized metal-binding protein